MLFKSLQTLFLPFKVPCDFWLKGRQNVLGRKVSKKALECGEKVLGEGMGSTVL